MLICRSITPSTTRRRKILTRRWLLGRLLIPMRRRRRRRRRPLRRPLRRLPRRPLRRFPRRSSLKKKSQFLRSLSLSLRNPFPRRNLRRKRISWKSLTKQTLYINNEEFVHIQQLMITLQWGDGRCYPPSCTPANSSH